MLCSANQAEAKVAIDLYFMKYKENPLDTLTLEDWEDLQKLQDFLLFFHHATLATEGRGSTIEQVLPNNGLST